LKSRNMGDVFRRSWHGSTSATAAAWHDEHTS
jgi:hypothetical protein